MAGTRSVRPKSRSLTLSATSGGTSASKSRTKSVCGSITTIAESSFPSAFRSSLCATTCLIKVDLPTPERPSMMLCFRTADSGSLIPLPPSSSPTKGPPSSPKSAKSPRYGDKEPEAVRSIGAISSVPSGRCQSEAASLADSTQRAAAPRSNQSSSCIPAWNG